MFIEETSKNTIIAYTISDEETTTVQTITKGGVFYTTTWRMDQMTTINEYGAEHKSDPFYLISLRRNLIIIKPFKNCQDGYTANKNGKCVLKFEDLSN